MVSQPVIVDQRGNPLGPVEAMVERKYRAATPNNFTPLPPPSVSGNAVMDHARGRLADWGRNLEENHDLSAQMVRLKARAMVKQEMIPMARLRSGGPAEELNRRIADLMREWVDHSDAMELYPWERHRMLIGGSYVRDGEVFVRHFLGDERPGRRIHYSFAAYEMDFVPWDLMRLPALDPGNRVVQGIEVDRVGRPVAVWMYPEHPSGLDGFSALEDLIRVPIDQITHLRHTRRLGQYRGASVLAPSLLRMANNDDYEGSEQFAAKIAGSVAVQLTRSPEAPGSAEINTKLGARTMQLQPGMMLDNLAPGEKWEVIDTSRPNPELNNYRKGQLQAATAGVGVSYSETTNDYAGTYSSQRQELVTTRQWYADDQAYWKAAFLKPVYKNLIRACMMQAAELRLSMLIQQADPATLFSFDTVPESIPQIDAAKEVKGDELEIAIGTESRHGIIRRRNRDPERVDRERAADISPGLAGSAESADEEEEESDNAESI